MRADEVPERPIGTTLAAIAHGRQVSTAADPQRLPEGSLAFRKSQVKSTVFRRTMLLAYDTNGVEPSDFAHWVAATMHVNPPD